MQTYIFSKHAPPKHNFFSGYAFVGEHIIFGPEGSQQYQDQTGEPIPHSEDGCYTCGLKAHDEITVGSDYVGNGRIFYYHTKHFWAFSNSFYRLTKYLRLQRTEGWILKKQPELEPKTHLLQAFNIRRPFGNQLQSFQTTATSIRLLPSGKCIKIKNNQLEIHDATQTEQRNYESHLQTYLNIWLSRIYTAINYNLPFSIDVTGGLDSRTTLAMFHRVREEMGRRFRPDSATFNSSERAILSEDLRIARILAEKYGFTLNTEPPRKQPQSLTPEERFSLWKDVALGTYSPYRMPAPRNDLSALSLGGGGGECFRAFYKKDNEIELINSCKKFFGDNESFRNWKRVVINDIKRIHQSDSKTPPLISHYRHFRTRFHTGTTAHYKNQMLPLQSRYLFYAANSIDIEHLESRQIAYDIIASCKADMLWDDFDNKTKLPGDSNLDQLTILSPRINQTGQVFGTHRSNMTTSTSIELSEGDGSLKALLHEALTRCEREMDPNLAPLFSIREAREFLERQGQNDPTLRPKEGRQVHNVLLAGFLSGVDI